MSEEKQTYEKAKGSLNKPAAGESYTARLLVGGVNNQKTKDGRFFDRWWCLVRLTTPFLGRSNEGDMNTRFLPNDLVFANVTGVHALRVLEDTLAEHGNQYAAGKWRIPDEKQVLITYSKKTSKTGGRAYYLLEAKVE